MQVTETHFGKFETAEKHNKNLPIIPAPGDHVFL